MDRQHAQELARKYQVRFLPVYVFLSDEKVWQERVTKRFNELNDQDVATWERIQHQREYFAQWEVDTALFIDSLNSVEENFARVLDFVNSNITLKPLAKVQLSQGRYHR
jgi:predicted kinase